MAYGTTASTPPVPPVQNDPLQEVPAEPIPEEEQERLQKDDPACAHHTRTVRQNLHAFYERNFGLVLVFLAQTCGSIMNTAAKLLATGYETKFHAMQIIFIRMSCTTVIGMLYMMWHKTPDFPLGARGIRWLLVLRGTCGFIGLFGLYYSLSWINISDATVITFMIPTLTALVCFIWLREPFTVREALAALVAFSGVLLVARPTWLFPNPPLDPINGQPEADAVIRTLMDVMSSPKTTPAPISPTQRTFAVLAAVLNAFGASLAYASIRVIGKRAHSLISVNYFAAIATVGSAAALLVHPDLHFVMPESAGQWGLIAIIGLTGFLLQFLLTEGLQREKAGRATNLMYLQLVLALIIERVIWGTTPPIESFGGAALIIGAAIWITLQKNTVTKEEKAKVGDEESRPLLAGEEGQEGRQT
ncbi:uncharacterized protein M421DRAFT_70737 [Didymella exigua CBS 183.55]|uniref:EamA domain-containing protein n=1 Tax=Didymella exigua CBS 183.55 TaxID=1150837 RepID=A0A6A5RDB0_9PLEO|nr:uncharacterized protein M421DRAFT_70737 [Didymella exigua CBS 183.55]KAF1925094.1 hypothetical protein M421DRAFT_70737 [Didymella exigua CBS 183.55]